MDPLVEELMMNMYNPGLNANMPLDDPRRRGMQQQGQGGLGGVPAGLARLLPFLMGSPYQNMTGLPGNLDMSNLSQLAQAQQSMRVPMAGENSAPASPTGQAITQPGGPRTQVAPAGYGESRTGPQTLAIKPDPSGSRLAGLRSLLNTPSSYAGRGGR